MPKKVIKILSIDGGGMRGVVPGMVLSEFEERTGKRIFELFDLIAGTSTGSILAMGITAADETGKHPQMTASELTNIIAEGGKEIFARSLWHSIKSANSIRDSKYPDDGLQATFDKYFGKRELKDALAEVLVPTYDMEAGNAFFFKRHEARNDERKNFYMSDVIQSSCSAPVYFPPHLAKPINDPLVDHYAFIDGGMAANNPAMCAYVEAKALFPDADEYMVVSLGTGEGNMQMLYELFDQWGAIQWVMPLINILLGGSTDMVDHQLKTLFHTEGDSLNHYYRLQTRLSEPMGLDTVDDTGVHKIRLVGENLIVDNHKLIEEICSKLTDA